MDFHLPVDPSKKYEDLDTDEKLRLEHQRLHEQHKGHNAMHAEMLIILFVTMVVAQVALVEWRKRHHRSFSICTLLGLWLIPIVYCVKYQWWRFTVSWMVFSCFTIAVMRKALQKPVAGSTPRLVYKWFYFIYKLSYALGIIGYIIMMIAFLGFTLIFCQTPNMCMDVGFLFLYYGLYFGVLGRDISEMCSDKMAANIGYYSPSGMPLRSLGENMCAVCGNELVINGKEEDATENMFKLSCQHVFHEFCIRGWCIIGKKQTCPYCKEKVDLKRLFSNPWERPHVMYGQLLDWIRWLVAWQPFIFGIVHAINLTLGLE